MALAPDPRRVHGVVHAIKLLLDEFERGYSGRYADVYGPQGGSLGRGGPIHESRPTELAAARATKRSQTLQAWATALLAIHTATKRLARATRPKVEAPDTGSLDAYPPLISPDEHKALLEARTRRVVRGE